MGALGGTLMRLLGRKYASKPAGEEAQEESGSLFLPGKDVAALFAGYLLSQVLMWVAHNKSLEQLPLLHVTVLNLVANTLASGVLGLLCFQEALTLKWLAGCTLVVLGTWVIVQSQEHSLEKKEKEKEG